MNPLWEQFELHYVRRRPPFRAWKRTLSVGCALLAAAWALAAGVRRDSTMFSSGPMSRGHAHLASNCAACHTESWRTLADLVPSPENDRAMNRACLHCHGGSIRQNTATANAWHQPQDDSGEPSRPTHACSACHAEHEGPVSLREVPDADCVRCHADLGPHRPAGIGTSFASSITSFAGDHPEFAVIEKKKQDEARLFFHHAKHLDAKSFPDQRQMVCSDCHRAGLPAANAHIGDSPQREVNEATLVSGLKPQADYMDPIRYSLHCQNCHPLSVDGVRKRLNGTGNVPHDSPSAVRTFLWGALTQYINAHPEELERYADAAPPRHTPFGGPHSGADEELDRRKIEWVDRERRILETQLFDTKLFCGKCHEFGTPSDVARADLAVVAHPDRSVPSILEPKISARWFEHASFDHERHRTMNCDECHPLAKDSKLTADVLLPGIDVCRKCHAPAKPSSTSGASDRCVLCHTYHVPDLPRNEQSSDRKEALLDRQHDEFIAGAAANRRSTFIDVGPNFQSVNRGVPLLCEQWTPRSGSDSAHSWKPSETDETTP